MDCYQVSLGPTVLLRALSLEKELENIEAFPYRLDFKAGELANSIEKEERSFVFEEQLESKYILAASAAVAASAGFEDSWSNPTMQEEVEYHNLSKKLLLVGAAALFMLSILGYFINDALRKNLSNEQAALTTLNELHKEEIEKIERQKQFQNVLGEIKSPVRYSRFLTEICEIIPKEITLTFFQINPLITKGSKRADEMLGFDDNSWIIEGNAASSEELEWWVKEIENRAWVTNARVAHFEYNRREEEYEFELSVKTQWDGY
tara:strand:- start:352 stop:1140 length:789 start_codon:yes stop_codon:yes gene_type:complete